MVIGRHVPVDVKKELGGLYRYIYNPEGRVVCLAIGSSCPHESKYDFSKSINFFQNQAFRDQLMLQHLNSIPVAIYDAKQLHFYNSLIEAETSNRFKLTIQQDVALGDSLLHDLIEATVAQIQLPENWVTGPWQLYVEKLRNASVKRLVDDVLLFESAEEQASKRLKDEEHSQDTEQKMPPPPPPLDLASFLPSPTVSLQTRGREHDLNSIRRQATPPPSPAVPANSERRWRATEYNNTIYRSKLEANTAYFMDLNHIAHRYEKVSVNLQNGHTYTPDFWLVEQKLFIEIKPAYPHLDEMSKCEEVASNGFDIVLLYGYVGAPLAYEDHHSESCNSRPYDHSRNARGIAWSGKTGKRCPGDWIWVYDSSVNRVVLAPWFDSKDTRWKEGELLLNYEKVQLFGPK